MTIGWDPQEADILDTGLAPIDAFESAILMVLPPGTYTAIVQGNNLGPGATSGTALVEVYNISLTIAVGLDNISTRGAVQRIADPMIAGLVIANGDEDTVLVRGLGPSLDDFGLAGLSDPHLDLFDAEGNVLASNDRDNARLREGNEQSWPEVIGTGKTFIAEVR